jgi:hypothetical protein
MASNGTPPHITALFDQGQAQQREHDQLPEGVVLQVRLRPVELDGGTQGLASSFLTSADNLRQAAAILVTLEATVNEYTRDVADMLADLAKRGPAGLIESMEIMADIQAARHATVERVGGRDD